MNPEGSTDRKTKKGKKTRKKKEKKSVYVGAVMFKKFLKIKDHDYYFVQKKQKSVYASAWKFATGNYRL